MLPIPKRGRRQTAHMGRAGKLMRGLILAKIVNLLAEMGEGVFWFITASVPMLPQVDPKLP